MKTLVAILMMLLVAASCPAIEYHDLPNDCMLVAIEAHKRLEGAVAWEDVICFQADDGNGKRIGHCVLAFQVVPEGRVFLYDYSGTIVSVKNKNCDNSILGIVKQIEQITKLHVVLASFLFKNDHD